MLLELAPAFTVLGVAVIGDAVCLVLEHYGHSKKVPFVKIITYIASAYICFNTFWKYVRYVSWMFGVPM